MKLPVKLGKEPLVEAVFEVRFNALFPASSILPGMLFSNLQAPRSVDRLPPSNLPEQVRNLDPNLMYAPLVKIGWDAFTILMSDRSVGLACTLPYPGWGAFKRAILKVFEVVGGANVVQSVERFSLKYTNIFPAELGEITSIVNLDLKIGPHSAEGNNIQIRAEIRQGEILHLVNLASSASGTLVDGTFRSGALLDIDSVAMIENTKFSDFFDNLSDRTESVHTENKAMFFMCVRPDIVQKLEPVYE